MAAALANAAPTNEPGHFMNALLGIGMTPPSVDKFVEEGITNCHDLSRLTEKDVENTLLGIIKDNRAAANPVANVKYPLKVKKGLEGFRYWSIQRSRTNQNMDSSDFGTPDDDCEPELSDTLDLKEQRKQMKDAADSLTPERPKPFRDFTKWASASTTFKQYLNNLRGAAEVPILYCIRDEVEVDDDALEDIYEDIDQQYIRITTHEGAWYKTDNRTLFQEIESWIGDGPGKEYIQPARRGQNGRKAWLALIKQAEGPAAKTSRRHKAYKIMQDTTFSGARRNWTFQQYIERHTYAHNELADEGEVVDEPRKVSHFLNGIRDSMLRTQIRTGVIGTKRLNDFNKCQQYLAAVEADGRHFSSSSDDKRNVSEVNRGSRGPVGKNGQPVVIKGATYPRSEWFNLTEDQQEQVRALRNKKPNNPPKKSYARKVAELKRQVKELKAAAADEDSSSDEEVAMAPPANDAGNEFGKSGHKRDKKKRKNQGGGGGGKR